MTNNQKLQLGVGVFAAALATWWTVHSGRTTDYKTEGRSGAEFSPPFP